MTLVEIMFVTVIIGFLVMLVSGPLSKAREKAMVAATKADIKNAEEAINFYLTEEMEWPATLDDLDDTYEQSPDIIYCTFQVNTGASLESGSITLAAMHRGSTTLVTTTFPTSNGRMTETVANAGSCPSPIVKKAKKTKTPKPKKKRGG